MTAPVPLIDRFSLATVDRFHAGTGGQHLLKTLFVCLLIGGGSVVLSTTLAIRIVVMIVSTNVLVMILEDYLSLVLSLVQYAWGASNLISVLAYLLSRTSPSLVPVFELLFSISVLAYRHFFRGGYLFSFTIG